MLGNTTRARELICDMKKASRLDVVTWTWGCAKFQARYDKTTGAWLIGSERRGVPSCTLLAPLPSPCSLLAPMLLNWSGDRRALDFQGGSSVSYLVQWGLRLVMLGFEKWSHNDHDSNNDHEEDNTIE